jgi:hypothetical protein
MAVLQVESTHPESQGPYVLIEEENFNPDIHVLYEPNKVEKPKKELKEPKAPKEPEVKVKEPLINALGDK